MEKELAMALKALIGDGGTIPESECYCDETHEKLGTLCNYCFAREVLESYETLVSLRKKANVE